MSIEQTSDNIANFEQKRLLLRLPHRYKMAFYDLPKHERAVLATTIKTDIEREIAAGQTLKVMRYFSDGDAYTRKTAYLSIGRFFFEQKELQDRIINSLDDLWKSDDLKVRQTVINSAGEIGKKQFERVQQFFDKGLFNEHHAPRNAVIGSIKKMGEVNPTPVLNWAKKYLHHPDKR